MNIEQILRAVPQYLYAGAIRVGVDDAVTGVILAARKAGASEDTITFLRGPFGSALIRLALGAAFEILPQQARPPVTLQADVQHELLVSASALGLTGLQSAMSAIGSGLIERLRLAAGAES